MCLLDNREVRKGWQPLKDAVAAIFAKHGAQILSSRRWDERPLGYPIRGQKRGTYLLLYFKAETAALALLRRDLQFAEYVLRFLTLQCEDVPAEAYESESEFDVDAIPEEGTDVDDEQGAEEATAEEATAEEESEDEGEAEESAAAEDAEPEAKTEA